mmetsp:Transcript_38596/g.110434  ORF Transcript_38596/g.110434 Transcript_38596/m.110434 type:complete len:427 (+) Transcript_38596:114-1394(+)
MLGVAALGLLRVALAGAPLGDDVALLQTDSTPLGRLGLPEETGLLARPRMPHVPGRFGGHLDHGVQPAGDRRPCLGHASGHNCSQCPSPPGAGEGRSGRAPEGAEAPLQRTDRIAVFAQVFNHTIWGEIRDCIANVGQARGARTVDVYVAVVREAPGIAAELQRMKDSGSVSQAAVQLVRNQGADIGQFMQQIQEPRGKYDLVLKMHSKTGNMWRKSMLGSLCGSPDQVESIWQQFEGNTNLGIVGPPAWTWTYPSDVKETLRSKLLGSEAQTDWVPPKRMQNWMKVAWGVIYPCEILTDFPDPKQFGLLAGSTYWSRAYPLLENDALRKAIPMFLEMFGQQGYHTGCDTEPCHHMYALERVIPTMIKARFGLEIDIARDNRPPEGWMPNTTDKVGGHAWKTGDHQGAAPASGDHRPAPPRKGVFR